MNRWSQFGVIFRQALQSVVDDAGGDFLNEADVYSNIVLVSAHFMSATPTPEALELNER